MQLLGVRIDNLSRAKILGKIESFLNDGKFHQIATVNPEFILEAQKNDNFRNILNKADLNIADGIGIKFAFFRFGKVLKDRIAGVDLTQDILQLADEKKLSVFLAISKNSLSSYEEVKKILSDKYPNIELGGQNIDPSNPSLYKIQNTKYKILFCNFGAPHQEEFIFSQKNDIIGIAMGVGGSFDYLTGKIKRAPKIMRYFGLEWLFRLFQEPKYRIKKIIRAIIIFPIKIIF